MCIIILRVAVAKILSVASLLHVCRERSGGVRDRRRVGVQGGDRGVWGGGPHAGGGLRATIDWLS